MPATPPEPFTLDRMTTPIGEALLVTDRAGRLVALEWADYESRMALLLRRQHRRAVTLVPGRAPDTLRARLGAYFAGDFTQLSGIAVEMPGTPFQRAVWTALRAIPAGTTMSYGGLAARLGIPKAVRAVGLANGANPVSVVVPCHRVIGTDGSLTGYGGGLERKRWLLRHEGVRVKSGATQFQVE